MRRTKIVCTLGPGTCDEASIFAMVKAGMNVCRLNFSHGSHDYYKGVITTINKVRSRIETPLAILMDTKGPEIRLGHFEGEIKLHQGQKIRLVRKKLNSSDLEVFPESVVDELKVGLDVYIDDGKIHTKVLELFDGGACIEVQNCGQISSKKSVNIPKGNISLPLLTQKDVEDITFAANHGVDFIAASFVCHTDQVFAIKKLLQKLNREDIRIISKIESQCGIDHFDAILDACDGIMVARGDLGVEVRASKIPQLQKKMIHQANLKGKISITATQMLESMVVNPFPLRAEISDVANSIYDGTSAVMLSGETAVGKWPIKVIETMHEIICETEEDFAYDDYFLKMQKSNFSDVSSAIALSSVKICQHTTATAIIAATSSGRAAISISRFHPRQRIIAITPNLKTYNQMALVWGVVVMMEKYQDIAEGFRHISCTCLQMEWVNYGDLVVITSGEPFGKSYTTNTIIVDSIGKVIVRARPLPECLTYPSVRGHVVFYHSNRLIDQSIDQNIVVVSVLSEKILEGFGNVKGVILQNQPFDSLSLSLLSNFCKKNEIPAISSADEALSLLNEGQEVILDAKRGIVFDSTTYSEKEMLIAKQK